MKKFLQKFVLAAVMIFAITPIVNFEASQATIPAWRMNDVIVRVDGEATDIRASGSTSQLELPLASVLLALNLPANYIAWDTNNIRQHELAELFNIEIIYDMYYRTVDIVTNSQSAGLSRVLPVQYIPRYGWVRMTNEMLRDIEQMLGNAIVNQRE